MESDAVIMDTSGAVKVLVVEDNSALANVLKFNLERSGYAVTICATGVKRGTFWAICRWT